MNMRHELLFDPPPRLNVTLERRLAARALELWHRCREGAALPAAADLAGLWPGGSVHRRIELTVSRAGALAIDGVDEAVSRTFALEPGPLAASTNATLSALLAAAGARMIQTCAPAEFAAMLAGGAGGGSLLTRGVVLPLADTAGRLASAVAVVTWKEGLDDPAQAELNREVAAALMSGTAPTAARRHAAAALDQNAPRNIVIDAGS